MAGSRSAGAVTVIRRARPPRLVVLSHSAVERTHQRKWELVAQAGWEVLLLVPRTWPEAGRLQRATARRAGGLAVAVIPAVGIGRLARWAPLGLSARIAAFAPELVFAEEEPYAVSCWVAARAAAKAGARFGFFTWENQRRGYTVPQRLMVRLMLRRAAGAVAGNAEAGRLLRARGFRRPVAIVPQYGFPRDQFHPGSRRAARRRLRWPESGSVVGYVGRLLEEKGLATLIEAVAALPPRVTLAVVGSGPDEAATRRLAAIRLPGRVRFVGAMARHRIGEIMRALDVLVLPSRTTPVWKEQFGRVLVEAMACGRWALGSSSGEIPRVLGEPRLVFPEGDAPALTRRLAACLGRTPPASLRRRSLECFSDEAVARGTDHLLRSLIRR